MYIVNIFSKLDQYLNKPKANNYLNNSSQIISLIVTLFSQMLTLVASDVDCPRAITYNMDLIFHAFPRNWVDDLFYLSDKSGLVCWKLSDFKLTWKELQTIDWFPVTNILGTNFGIFNGTLYVAQYSGNSTILGRCHQFGSLGRKFNSSELPWRQGGFVIHFNEFFQIWSSYPDFQSIKGDVPLVETAILVPKTGYKKKVYSKNINDFSFQLISTYLINTKTYPLLIKWQHFSTINYDSRYIFSWYWRIRRDPQNLSKQINEIVLSFVCPNKHIYFELRFNNYTDIAATPSGCFAGDFDFPESSNYFTLTIPHSNNTSTVSIYLVIQLVQRMIEVHSACQEGHVNKELGMVNIKNLLNNMTTNELICAKSYKNPSNENDLLCNMNETNNLLSGLAKPPLISYTFPYKIIYSTCVTVNRPWFRLVTALVHDNHDVSMCQFDLRNNLATKSCEEISFGGVQVVTHTPRWDVDLNRLVFFNADPKDKTLRTTKVLDCRIAVNCFECEGGGYNHYCNWEGGKCINGKRGYPEINKCYKIESYSVTALPYHEKIVLEIVLDGITLNDKTDDVKIMVADRRFCSIRKFYLNTINCEIEKPKLETHYVQSDISLNQHDYRHLQAKSSKTFDVIIGVDGGLAIGSSLLSIVLDPYKSPYLLVTLLIVIFILIIGIFVAHTRSDPILDDEYIYQQQSYSPPKKPKKDRRAHIKPEVNSSSHTADSAPSEDPVYSSSSSSPSSEDESLKKKAIGAKMGKLSSFSPKIIPHSKPFTQKSYAGISKK